MWKKFNENFFDVSQAHDNAIKCLAMDPHEEFFVTGSADGDIKVSPEWKWRNLSKVKQKYWVENLQSVLSGVFYYIFSLELK